MPRINLLPHRERKRKERKLAFMVALVAAAGVGIVTSFAAYLLYGSMIEGQERRNTMLRTQIKQLDKQIEEINDLESAKQKYIARMEIIEKLQRSRPEIVHVFDEIVRTLPEGVYLTAVKQTGKQLKFEGIAQSSTRVSSFMRNIDGSQWLRNPELQVVQTGKGTGPSGSTFVLTAQETPTPGVDDASGPKNVKGKIRKASIGGSGAQQ
jgi:type IV pilus assembly protein PilN